MTLYVDAYNARGCTIYPSPILWHGGIDCLSQCKLAMFLTVLLYDWDCSDVSAALPDCK